MNNTSFSHLDETRSRLRATVAALGRELSLLPAPKSSASTGTPHRLDECFADLVEQLALGPEPEVRDCPYCGEACMHAATLCSSCWSKLTPPPPNGRDGISI
jgi:hypothetical protein